MKCKLKNGEQCTEFTQQKTKNIRNQRPVEPWRKKMENAKKVTQSTCKKRKTKP